MSWSFALETRVQDLPWPPWPVSAHTSAVQPHVRHRVPLLRPSAVGATAARDTRAPLASSTRDRSIPPPSRACTVATSWLSHSRELQRAQPDPNQVTTPIGTRFSADQTITVLDPRHPLCGRTLPLVALTHHSQLGRCCVVWLQPHVERFIPIQATNLEFDPNDMSLSPLSLAAVEQLLRVFQDIQHAHQGVSRDASPSRPSRTASQARRPDYAPSAVEPPVSRPATACPTGSHPRCPTVDGPSTEPTPN
jgi:hypothetical protein